MTIVATVDGDQIPSQTVEVGYDLARQYDEELVVLHVMSQETFDELRDTSVDQVSVPPAPGISYGKSAGSETPYSIEDAEKDAIAVGREVADETLGDWHDVTFRGRVGEPAKEILDEAERTEPRYLVVGGRKRTPVGKAIFGSITQSILLNANLPVVTVMAEE